jgi:voltage-gated potassium channel
LPWGFVLSSPEAPKGEVLGTPKPHEMPNRPPLRRVGQRLERRAELKGLAPRFAAYVIVAFWSLGVVVFGVAEHFVDPDTFGNIWLGMWWAIQTVTTVGYGDVVPASTAGKIIAGVLMLGGLSLFAVVTGAITSAFVAQAQAQRRPRRDPVTQKLDEMTAQLEAIKAELARLDRSSTD